MSYQGDSCLNPTPVRTREQYIFLTFFIIISIVTIVDVIKDLQEGLSLGHISHELGLVLLCSVLIFYQFKILRKKNTSLEQMTITLGHLSEENQKIKNALKKFSGQLHELIDQQLS